MNPIIRSLISPRPKRCEAAAVSPPCEKPHDMDSKLVFDAG